jgi:uncharacterized membrane protein
LHWYQDHWLDYVPGAILVSIVAPIVFACGLAEAVAAVVLVVVTGVGSVLVLRVLVSALA